MGDSTRDEVPFQSPYPSYRVLDKWDSVSFNDATRAVLEDRLNHVPERRHFDAVQFALLRSIVDCLLPQPERSESTRIPVEAFLDEMLDTQRGSGTRYVDVPESAEAWRRGLAGIAHESRRHHGKDFTELSSGEQASVLRTVDAGDVDAAAWPDTSPQRFFRHLLLAEAVKIYYSHPSAWDEMGFGGPAAPRGYLRMGIDEIDPWEAPEERAPQPVRPLDRSHQKKY